MGGKGKKPKYIFPAAFFPLCCFFCPHLFIRFPSHPFFSTSLLAGLYTRTKDIFFYININIYGRKFCESGLKSTRWRPDSSWISLFLVIVFFPMLNTCGFLASCLLDGVEDFVFQGQEKWASVIEATPVMDVLSLEGKDCSLYMTVLRLFFWVCCVLVNFFSLFDV